MMKYSLQLYITLMSHERHSILNHRQLACLFNSSFRLKPNKTWTLIASHLEGNPLMTGGSPSKASVMLEAFLCHVVNFYFAGSRIWNQPVIIISSENSLKIVPGPQNKWFSFKYHHHYPLLFNNYFSWMMLLFNKKFPWMSSFSLKSLQQKCGSLISLWSCIFASVNRVSIGSDNGLSPIRRQVII